VGSHAERFREATAASGGDLDGAIAGHPFEPALLEEKTEER
jgi:hypothetical protein